MKIDVIFKTESNEKLNLILKMAYEMGMHVQLGDTDLTNDADSESRETYKAQLNYLKADFQGETPSQQKVDLLIKVAKAIGIDLVPISQNQPEDTLVSQQ